MKYYNLNTEFTFGKHKGKTVKDIIEMKETDYFNWCMKNLEHFYMSEDVIQEITQIDPSFSISKETEKILEDKLCKWEEAKERYREERGRPSGYQDTTDWTHYNDDLDMDQQGIEFWNQF